MSLNNIDLKEQYFSPISNIEDDMALAIIDYTTE